MRFLILSICLIPFFSSAALFTLFSVEPGKGKIVTLGGEGNDPYSTMYFVCENKKLSFSFVDDKNTFQIDLPATITLQVDDNPVITFAAQAKKNTSTGFKITTTDEQLIQKALTQLYSGKKQYTIKWTGKGTLIKSEFTGDLSRDKSAKAGVRFFYDQCGLSFNLTQDKIN